MSVSEYILSQNHASSLFFFGHFLRTGTTVMKPVRYNDYSFQCSKSLNFLIIFYLSSAFTSPKHFKLFNYIKLNYSHSCD